MAKKTATPPAGDQAPPEQAEGNGKARKTPCPVSRAQFRAGARPLVVQIGDQRVVAEPKEFSTGSLGWYAQGKITQDVGGVPVSVQVGLNLTVVNSKELPTS
jgi:hypothetical protein